MKRSTSVAVFFPLWGMCALATAQMAPVSQMRTVQSAATITLADGTQFTDGGAASAPDFGPFVAAEGCSLNESFSTVNCIGQQSSTIAPRLVQVDSLADSFATTSDPNFEETASGSGSSRFALTFDVTSPGLFRLDATASAIDSSSSSMALSQEANILAELDSSSSEPELHLTLALATGRYLLVANASASAFVGFGREMSAGRSTITVSLAAIPEMSAASLAFLALVGAARRRGKR